MTEQATRDFLQREHKTLERLEQERGARLLGAFEDPHGSGTVAFWNYGSGVYKLHPELALGGGWCDFGELLTAALAHFRQKLPTSEQICAVTWYYDGEHRPGLIVVTESARHKRP